MSDEIASKEIVIVKDAPETALVPAPRQNIGKLSRRTIFDISQQEFERLNYMAMAYAKSSFNSGSKKKTEGDYFLIIMKGLEVGFSPMAAVDSIDIIGGEPVIDAKGLLGLVYSSGQLESISIDSTAERCIITGKRYGYEEQIVSFTMEEARTFKTTEWKDNTKRDISLAEKANWKSQPEVMLKWRAVTKFIRQVFPDVSSNLYTREEMDTDTIVKADGTMLSSKTPALTDGTNSEQKASDSTPLVAWHEDMEKLKQMLSHCAAKGWIVGETVQQQLDNFVSLVGKPIAEFETGKTAVEAAQLEAEKIIHHDFKKEASETAKGEEGAWHSFETVAAVVDWAKAQGYGDNEPALIKLLNVKDWDAFMDETHAKAAIKTAFEKSQKPAPATPAKAEKTSLTDIDMDALNHWAAQNFNFTAAHLATVIDLSKYSTTTTVKTILRQKALEGAWPIIAEKATYYEKSKFIAFATAIGDIRFYSRNKFKDVIGETYFVENGIENLPDGKEQDIEPILITWEQKGSGDTAYKMLKKAETLLPEFA